MGIFSVPAEVTELTDTFRDELAAIRGLLERLLEIEEAREAGQR